jgi:DNA-binding NarL/FixJ family response regulator
MSSRARHSLVVCGAHPGHGEAVVAELAEFGYDVHHCADEESLVEAAASVRPRAIVYELQHQLSVDLAILALVRRIVPHVPLIVVACGHRDQAERGLESLHPTVLEHDPVDRGELLQAVQRAIQRSRAGWLRDHVVGPLASVS